MNAALIVIAVVVLLAAAFGLGRRLTRHPGQRADRLADLDRDDMDPRWLRPPPQGWPADMEWPPPKITGRPPE